MLLTKEYHNTLWIILTKAIVISFCSYGTLIWKIALTEIWTAVSMSRKMGALTTQLHRFPCPILGGFKPRGHIKWLEWVTLDGFLVVFTRSGQPFYLAAQQLEQLKQKVLEGKNVNPQIDTKAFKNIFCSMGVFVPSVGGSVPCFACKGLGPGVMTGYSRP